MVGITIQNSENENDKPIGICFRRKDQFYGGCYTVLGSKAFTMKFQIDHDCNSVRMPVGFVRAIKSRDRPLKVMAHPKRSVMELKAAEICLAYAIIIAIAKVENDPDYKAYLQGRKIRPVVQKLLDKTVLDLSVGGGIPELFNIFGSIKYPSIDVWHVKT